MPTYTSDEYEADEEKEVTVGEAKERYLRRCKACDKFGHTAVNCRKKNASVINKNYNIVEQICRFPSLDPERVLTLGTMPPLPVTCESSMCKPFNRPDDEQELLRIVDDVNRRQILDTEEEFSDNQEENPKKKSQLMIVPTDEGIVETHEKQKKKKKKAGSVEGGPTEVSATIPDRVNDLYCYCQKPWDGNADTNMVGCSSGEKCHDKETTGSWVHINCVNISEEHFVQLSNNTAEWYCPGCILSKNTSQSKRKARKKQ